MCVGFFLVFFVIYVRYKVSETCSGNKEHRKESGAKVCPLPHTHTHTYTHTCLPIPVWGMTGREEQASSSGLKVNKSE